MYYVCAVTCGVEITNLTTTGPIYLASPNHPLNYPSNVDCVWLFIDDTPGTYIITIMDFVTEWWDDFMMGHGTAVSPESQGVRISSMYYPKTIVVQEMGMWVRFVSNHEVEFSGFLVEVERKHEQGSYFILINTNNRNIHLLASQTLRC